MLLTCPICHARYSIDAILQDESARELLALSAQAGRLWPALIKYLGLFRSENRALAWDKALRLSREVLELPGGAEAIEIALNETVDTLRGRINKPLKNHNYLKRVLENTSARPVAITTETMPAQPQKISKTAEAIMRLQGRKQR